MKRYAIFLISNPKHRLWVLVHVPTDNVFNKNIKIIKFFLLQNFQFLHLKKKICILHVKVFVMYDNWHVETVDTQIILQPHLMSSVAISTASLIGRHLFSVLIQAIQVLMYWLMC